MKKNINNQLVLISFFCSVFLIVCFSFVLSAQSMTAREVMQKMENVDDGKTSISEMTMILIDKSTNKRVRQMKAFRKDFGKDTKNISFFMSPADVKDTSFLSYEYDDENKKDENWLYLPALRKVKRIASGNKKDSFMGSDFTYSDMNGIELNEWDFKFAENNNQMIDGNECWVIAAEPKKEIRDDVIKETGYVEGMYWIRKDNYLAIKMMSTLNKRKKIKIFKASDIEKIQGIWTVKTLEMTTYQVGKGNKNKRLHKTIIQFKNIVYDKNVNDNMFTTQRMEKGL